MENKFLVSGEKRKKKFQSGYEKRKMKEQKERGKIAESCLKLTSFYVTKTGSTSSTSAAKCAKDEKSQDFPQINVVLVCFIVITH